MNGFSLSVDVMNSGVFTRTSPSYDLGKCKVPYSLLFGTSQDQEELSGVPIDEWSSLQIPPYWRAINFLSDLFSKVPFHVMKVDEDGGSEPDKEHPAYLILRRQASPTQLAFHWKKQILFHALNWGNYIGRIRRDASGAPVSITSLDPTTTVLGRTRDGRMMYATPSKNGQVAMILPENVFHIFGLSYDGMWGLRPIEFFQYALGRASAHNRYASSFYGRGANPSGIVRAPSGLDEEHLKMFQKSFNEAYAGLKNSNKFLLLEEDAEFIPITVNPKDAQYAEGNELTARDVCNLFGLPPSTMALQDAQSYNSLEMSKQSELDAVDPWLCQMEEVASAKLLSTSELMSGTHKVKARREALKVIDHRTNVEMGLRELESGVLLVNEYRNAHDRGSLDEAVNRPRMPLNIGYADEPRDTQQSGSQEAQNAVLIKFLSSAHNKFIAQAKKQCRKPKTFVDFVDGGYDEYVQEFSKALGLVGQCAGVNLKEKVLPAILEMLDSLNQLTEVPDGHEKTAGLIDTLTFEWETLLWQKKS